ncbi:MAG: UV DNA damage repair endonuclease UvsE [Bradymonadales bacterium]|nr:UV DNA damage repair endonuclease UvsE [Bradymonadales bacterium]
MRLGLCCKFHKEPIRFRTTTARSLASLGPAQRMEKIRAIVAHNAAALRASIEYCAGHGIGCFRVNSQILPLGTHPQLGYHSQQLGNECLEALEACGMLARERQIRLTFHPDQFVVLNSPHPAVVNSSLAEITHQAEVAEWIGADVINIHGGGSYGDKAAALRRLVENLCRLPEAARRLITLENDDRTFTPKELLPVCKELGLPLVYDIHHHRCHGDGLDAESATREATGTWDREPLFHLSSPRDGWHSKNPRPHADYIDPDDIPRCWEELECTVEVEAKAKELAVLRLADDLARRRMCASNSPIQAFHPPLPV